MNVWIAIGLTVAGCYLAKLLGLLVPAGVLERPLVQRMAALLPVARGGGVNPPPRPPWCAAVGGGCIIDRVTAERGSHFGRDVVFN
ncbi:hypothetical protein ACFWJY_18535, partial [Streptomyces anulatus]